MGTSEGGGGSSGSGGDSGPEEKNAGSSRSKFEHSGWVYHLGTNSIKRESCNRRFLHIKGKYVMMYKRDPHEHSGTKPIRRGVVGHTLKLEELGCRKVNDGDLYVLKFSNRLDEEKKGEIGCATAGETRKWMEALEQAKKQAELELSQTSNTRNKLSKENEIDLERQGHRNRVKRYASGLKRLISIKRGESLVRRSLSLSGSNKNVEFCEGDAADVIEGHEWKCVRTLRGVRIFEDTSIYKGNKGVLVKAVGIMDVSSDSAFEVILSLHRHQRYEWDALTSDLELVDSISGNSDVVYGSYDPRHINRWKCRRDFIFSRQWFRDQDGAYAILHFPAVHKKKPPRSGYRRTKVSPSTWEIKNLSTNVPSNGGRCLVTHMLEVHSKSWSKWKNNQSSKFEKTIPYALLNQASGLKAYLDIKYVPNTKPEERKHESSSSSSSSSSTTVSQNEVSSPNSEYEEDEIADQFYDAISAYSSSDDDDSDYDDAPLDTKGSSIMLQTASFSNPNRVPDPCADGELDPLSSPITVDPIQLPGSMSEGKSESDINCWTSPNGKGFMIRGKTYLQNNAKVAGGNPLLRLVAVDWFKVENPVGKVALHPKCLVQSDAGKKLPFVLVMNLQVPAKPNYSLVLYFAADRPIAKDSLLERFINGTNTFRDSRFKLIPSIVDGYWMVKRAVGSKACLLGKAVTCNYLRQDNFLEIDVDVGSSSVARSVVGIVLGYVTSIVVDLAILIEGKEQAELPEYILGTVRLNRVRLESAVPLES
ncbi:protein ENHANCED DISEASE RESISTANCE 2 [Lactuca sativa]|uniref:protein ENHANCED DISEASE RESISTANCE 2 n=1 Tax=Lactuca sativa TaxID=4236 RepID=UPI0022AFA426|nr:protein ENHANCED DISEASE RESISTANCE 2 [Lactuca sativa]